MNLLRYCAVSFLLFTTVGLEKASSQDSPTRQQMDDVIKKMDAEIKKKSELGEIPHKLALSFFSYACDHNNTYPTGKSSTEVFQKLLDGKYITDPTIVYFPMPGKVAPTSSTLKPENVCWDVTSLVTNDTSDSIPLVFSTGYKITYEKEASAIPLTKSGISPVSPFLIAYKSNLGRYINSADDGSIPKVIAADFDPKGQAFHQLTPDGELPP